MFVARLEEEPHSTSPSPQTGRKPETRPLLLIIEDEEQMSRSLTLHFARDYRVLSAATGQQGLALAEQNAPVCVLLDLHLPGMSGLAVLEKLQQLRPTPLVVTMTAYGEIRSAVQAIKAGAADYVLKPFDVQQLRQDLAVLLGSQRRQRSVAKKASLGPQEKKLVGESPRIQEVWTAVEKFAPTDIPILLHGESGTGKELAARAIHMLGKGAQGNFVAVDCAAIPDSLWESEFFGYEKGAFTGANQTKPGFFTLASDGTLFLDEIANLSLSLQAKLLRVLQEGEVRPLGARRALQPNVRVVAASNADLTQLVSQGTFRADLYYRLGAVTIALPPLRERAGDVPLLIHHFLDLYGERYGKTTEISPEAMELLVRYPWPGNCRELENVIRSAALLAEDRLLPPHLPAHVRQQTSQHPCQSDTASPNGEEDQNVSPYEVNLQVDLKVDWQDGLDLKRVGATVARTVEKEVISQVSSLGLSQADMAAFLKVDPKTLRKLKAGKGYDARHNAAAGSSR